MINITLIFYPDSARYLRNTHVVFILLKTTQLSFSFNKMISIFFYDYADWLYILEKTPTILWFNYPSMSRISEPFDLIWWESRIFRTCLRTNFQAIWPRYHFPSNITYFTIRLAMVFVEKWYRAIVNCWLIWISVKYNFCYLRILKYHHNFIL